MSEENEQQDRKERLDQVKPESIEQKVRQVSRFRPRMTRRDAQALRKKISANIV